MAAPTTVPPWLNASDVNDAWNYLEENTTEAINGTASTPPPNSSTNRWKACIFWAIFLVGTSGNLLLIGVGIANRASGSRQALVTWMFVCSLAAADLGLMLTTTWTNAVAALEPSWTFGTFFCKLNSLSVTLTAKASIIILAIISVDRYLGMHNPGSGNYFSPRVAGLLIAGTWVGLIVTGVPLLLWFEVVPYAPTVQRCTIREHRLGTSIYTTVTQVALFYVPLLVTFGSYFRIWYDMHFAGSKVTPPTVQTQTNAANNSSSSKSASRKVARMCAVIVSIFAVCWVPFQTSLLYNTWGSNRAEALNWMSRLFIPASVNSCVNPIIYGFMWKSMRVALRRVGLNQARGAHPPDCWKQLPSP